MDYEKKTELLAEANEEAIVFHGIENALIGYIERCGQPPIAVYDYDLVIESLMEDDSEESYESALEWYGHNTIGTWAGDGTPAFLHRFEEETECEESSEKCMRLCVLLTKTATRITETLKSFGRWLRRDGK